MLSLKRHGVAPATLDDVKKVATAAKIVEWRADVDRTIVTDDVASYVAATTYTAIGSISTRNPSVHCLCSFV